MDGRNRACHQRATLRGRAAKLTIQGKGRDAGHLEAARFGDGVYPGWVVDGETERKVARSPIAPNQVQGHTLFDAVQTRGLAGVAMLPLGQFFVQTAFRNSIKGVREGSVCWFRNVSKT